MKKMLCAVAAVGAIGFGMATSASAASFADVAFVVDQSGSMRGEFAWIGSSLSSIDAALAVGGITATYGVAGYEQLAGSADSRNAWIDLPGSIASVVGEVNDVGGVVPGPKSTYGGTENHYHAAGWAADNFTWSGGDYAKVMVLITDEYGNNLSNYAYDGLTGETALGKKMKDENILLNVITFNNYKTLWDDAAYSTPGDATTDPYLGFFDLQELKNNPEQFTADFVAAKLKEIQNVPTPGAVPEPTTMLLFGTGLAGLAAVGRRKSKK